MNRFYTVLAIALLATPLAAMAHDDHEGSKAGPARKTQTEWGIAADAKAVRRTITLTMTDAMRFNPDSIDVKRGEVIRLVVKNNGHMLHELVLGTKAQLDAHTAMMAKFPNMEHDDPYTAHVKPGATGQIIWNFNRAGSFDFACLIAGHYQAGMVGKITVTGT